MNIEQEKLDFIENKMLNLYIPLCSLFDETTLHDFKYWNELGELKGMEKMIKLVKKMRFEK